MSSARPSVRGPASARGIETAALTVHAARSDAKGRTLPPADEFVEAVRRARSSRKSEDAALLQIYSMLQSFDASRPLEQLPMGCMVLAALQNGIQAISTKMNSLWANQALVSGLLLSVTMQLLCNGAARSGSGAFVEQPGYLSDEEALPYAIMYMALLFVSVLCSLVAIIMALILATHSTAFTSDADDVVWFFTRYNVATQLPDVCNTIAVMVASWAVPPAWGVPTPAFRCLLPTP